LPRKLKERKDEKFPKCRIIFVFIYRVLLAETQKTFSAIRLTGQIFFSVAAVCNCRDFFLSRWPEVAWKFGHFSVTEVPLGKFLTEQKKAKKSTVKIGIFNFC
jgi:hypothetical protein